jgi:DNA-binding beta-propeller fold protein YncE
MALFAQVVVDTVIRFPDEVGGACFLPELNKLYVDDHPNGYFVLDCSTYQLRPELPAPANLGHWSWNRRRLKLYVTHNPYPDKTMVIDAAGDSILRWLEVCYEMHTDAYLSDVDLRFKPAVDTLHEFECDADTVIRRLTLGGLSTCASWDSVGHKLYVGQGSRKELYVYDYLTDSVLKVIDVSAVGAVMPDACVFSRTHRRAYVSSFQGEPSYTNVGIVDTERDTLLRVLPVRLRDGLYKQVAVDEQDGKVYITDSDGWWNTPDTMWVVDCASDSVLKKFECAPRGHTSMCIRWVPWSNRIYLINVYPDPVHNGSLVVIDCNTDSVIVPGMLLGDYLYDIQLDPIRQRIFVVGDTNKVYVLRDTGYGGIAEDEPSGPRPASGLQVQMTSGGFDLSYSIASPCRIDLSVYDLMGREVKRLVAEQQPGGEHRVNWDCRDKNRVSVARGVYFARLDTPGFADVRKAVVSR